MPKTNRTLNEQFEFQGIWFLPEAKKNTIYGSVEYSRGNIHLEITKIVINTDVNNLSQAEKFQQDHIPIILGVAHTGEKITLQDCTLVNEEYKTRSEEKLRVIQYRYRVHQMFVGKHYESYKDIKFNSISTDFSSLGTWYTKSNISQESQPFSIEYKPVEPTEVKIDEEYSLKIQCSLSHTKNLSNRSTLINESVSLLIKKRDQQTVEYAKLDDVITCYRFFLMLATMHTVHPIRIIGYAKKQPVEIYPNIVLYENIQENIFSHKMLFTFNYIEERFADKIQKWRKLWEIYKEPITTYFLALLNQELISVKLSLLSIASALESYHREKYCRKKMPQEEYENMIKDMKEKLKDKKQRCFIDKFKKMGNAPSLNKRLNELIKIAPETFADVKKEKVEFVNKVVNTRNDYAHGAKELEKEAVSKSDTLHHLVEEMKLLMECCLLRELCFSQEQIEGMMKHNRKVRNYARDHP